MRRGGSYPRGAGLGTATRGSWSTMATRATAHERAAWAKAARKAGKTLSSWIRDTCNEAAHRHEFELEEPTSPNGDVTHRSHK